MQPDSSAAPQLYQGIGVASTSREGDNFVLNTYITEWQRSACTDISFTECAVHIATCHPCILIQ